MKKFDIFLIFAQIFYIDCRYSLEPPHIKAILTSTHNLCFRAKVRKLMYPPVNPSFTILNKKRNVTLEFKTLSAATYHIIFIFKSALNNLKLCLWFHYDFMSRSYLILKSLLKLAGAQNQKFIVSIWYNHPLQQSN